MRKSEEEKERKREWKAEKEKIKEESSVVDFNVSSEMEKPGRGDNRATLGIMISAKSARARRALISFPDLDRKVRRFIRERRGESSVVGKLQRSAFVYMGF